MKTLVKKMSSLGLLRLELIAGSVIMAIAMLLPPIGIFVADPQLMANPYVLGFVAIVMVFFGLLGFLLFIRPYIMYNKTPEVLAEADDEFLYIHGKKEAKIPLSHLSDSDVRAELPFILQKDFLREIVIHMFSEQYGIVILEVPGYGTYKMRFVSHAEITANELASFIYQASYQASNDTTA